MQCPGAVAILDAPGRRDGPEIPGVGRRAFGGKLAWSDTAGEAARRQSYQWRQKKLNIIQLPNEYNSTYFRCFFIIPAATNKNGDTGGHMPRRGAAVLEDAPARHEWP